jgi:hypothetical protein
MLDGTSSSSMLLHLCGDSIVPNSSYPSPVSVSVTSLTLFLQHTQTFATGLFQVVRDMLAGTSSSSWLHPFSHPMVPFTLFSLHAQTFATGLFQGVRDMLDGTSSSSLLHPFGHLMVSNSSYPSPVSVFVTSLTLFSLHTQAFATGFIQVVRNMLDGTPSSSLLRLFGHLMVPFTVFSLHAQTFAIDYFQVVRDMLDGTPSSSLLLRPCSHPMVPNSSYPSLASVLITSFTLFLLHTQAFASGFFQAVRGMLDGTSTSSLLLRPCDHPMITTRNILPL